MRDQFDVPALERRVMKDFLDKSSTFMLSFLVGVEHLNKPLLSIIMLELVSTYCK